MSFSGALKLADVSDFIAPSQACVVNLNSGKLDLADADGLQVTFTLLPPFNLRLPASARVQSRGHTLRTSSVSVRM